MYRKVFKRLMDLLMASLLIIMLLPVFAILVVVNYFVNRGSVWFVQRRTGLNEKEFTLYKFKTLLNKGTIKGAVIEDPITHNPMIMTRWGRFMRAYSLDEIPQLINVVRNDLSFVGPRPLLPEYLGYYDQRERKRHQVKPGITGLAQVKGRNMLDWPEKLAYDVRYVENISFLLDMKILADTMLQWFRPCKATLEISLIDYIRQSKQNIKQF